MCSIWLNHGINLYNSLEWCLNSPPKPHAFVSLPLQSKFNLNLKFDLSKIFNIIFVLGFIMSWSLFESNKAFSYLEYCDAPRPWGIYFQDSATPQMEGLVELHDNILFYLVIILFGVGWILLSIIRNYTNDKAPISHKYLNHGTLIELIWTITPALILILIAFPSFKLLYLMDEVGDPAMSVLTEGDEWYWNYKHPDYISELYLEDGDDPNVDFINSNILHQHNPETVTNKIKSSIKRFLTWDYHHYPSQFQPTTRIKFGNTSDMIILSEVHNLVLSQGAFKPEPVNWLARPCLNEFEYEDGSLTDGNSDLNEARDLIHSDFSDYYFDARVEEFQTNDWTLARLSRYNRVATLLCEKVNDKHLITGDIRALTEDEVYALHFYFPRVANADYVGNYNKIGPVTRLIIKTDAQNQYLQTKNALLVTQNALLQDEITA